MSERPDILALIDGAIHDVETSSDAMRWTPEPVKALVPAYAQIDPDAARRAGENIATQLQAFIDAFAAALAPVGRALAELCEALEPERVPDDPMQRALWLRQHRNTGPTPRQRAPRRIEPRRNR